MKKLAAFSFLLCLGVSVGFMQFARTLTALSADPTTCYNVGDIYFNTTIGKQKICTATGTPGTWTIVNASTAASVANTVMKFGDANNTTTGSSAIDNGTTFAVSEPINATGDIQNVGVLAISHTAPTISSGFGTSPSIVASNGSLAFTLNVGTGGTATNGVIGLPTATTGWVVNCTDNTTNSATVFVTKQTASTTTSATVGNFNTSAAAAAWVASDILRCQATAY